VKRSEDTGRSVLMGLISEWEKGAHFALKLMACKPQICEFLAATPGAVKVPKLTSMLRAGWADKNESSLRSVRPPRRFDIGRPPGDEPVFILR